jgi:eukaryotic-like serine/threonine-protein kinase
MESTPRYEILNTIAAGDFATVYRARDRELGREVAIKQIHQQFLSNPRQTERYWREAQLLASLQHPNILTIYDIVRPNGWLILELMRGNLGQSIQTGPLDLDFLRLALVCCSNALNFLHANGIIHGDVKPSNMLVDLQGRVKLGDFGLARRASSEQGSLLKGTTKYMAPELVSNQFGPVGPASDLYSLGFSAYELMCGPNFDSLFPGLSTFGRDRQIAWLMWHSAPDRQLPQIARVLEGVPPDLAQVIERMVVKDQSRRYQSAQDVLRDLRSGQYGPARPDADPSGAQAGVSRQKRLIRIAAVAAMAVSVILSIVLMLPNKPVRKAAPKDAQPVEGIVRTVFPDERGVVVESVVTGSPEQITFKPTDRFYINQKEGILRDLQPLDRISIEVHRDEAGRKVSIVHATRPQTQEGRIKSVEPASDKFTLAYGTGNDQVVVRVPATVKILLNGQDRLRNQPVKVADLKPGDRVEVSHLAEEGGRVATRLEVEREMTLAGIIRNVDAAKGEVTISQGEGAQARMITLPLAPKHEVTLNGSRVFDKRVLTPADLKPGDKATLTHDKRIVRVDAYRTLGQAGVVQAILPNALDVTLDLQGKATRFLVDESTKITLGGETIKLSDLRAGDAVDITHDTPDAVNPRALTVAARRVVEPTRWAVLVGVSQYDDALLGRLAYPAADATLLHETLVKRFGVPANQSLLLTDANQVRMQEGIGSLLERIPADGKLVIYFAGHAWQDADKTVYLAPKEFNKEQAAATGVSLQWLVDRMEQCKAKEKVLLLDACNSGPGIDPQKEPSTAEMFQALKTPPGQAALRTVTGIASCSKGERGSVLPDRQHGLFAMALSEGFGGQADKNRDNRLEVTELFSFVNESMNALGAPLQKKQTAQIFLPDNRPARLSAEAKKAIRAVAGLVRQNEVDLNAARSQYDAAQAAAGKETEPKLLFGLVLMKTRQRADAVRHFENLKIEHSTSPLPPLALAWLKFERRMYPSGVEELVELVNKLSKPTGPGDAATAEAQSILPWVGQLREFAAVGDEKHSTPAAVLDKLDAAVAEHGEAAKKLYEQGRTQTRDKVKQFDARIESAPDEATGAKLRIERRQVTPFAQFPYDAALQIVLAGLDR